MIAQFSLLSRCLFALGISCLTIPLYAEGCGGYCCLGSQLMPRLSITGLSGSETVGWGDAFLPLAGNGDNVFYADGQGNTSADTAGFASGGLGYRQVVADEAIVGSYLFYDRSVTNENNTFSVLSPGVEAMLENWDWRANGYFPVGTHHYTSITGFGETLGLPQYVSFSGHNQFDELVSFEDAVGNGVDSSVGYTIQRLNRLRMAAGVYYYHPTNLTSIRGVAGNVIYPLSDRFSVAAVDSYDNVQHNTIGVGLTINLGGIPTSQQEQYPNIHNRLADPVERNLSMQDQGGSIPDEMGFVSRSGPILTRSNIWFFTANGGSAFIASQGTANCTINNPCSGTDLNNETVTVINNIAPNANIYTNPGNYPIGSLIVNNGQSIFGRTLGYQLPAYYSGNLPIFTGGLTVNGNNTIQGIELLNDGTQTNGISATNATNVLLDHDVVGAENASQGYQTGLFLNNTQNIILQNSTVIAFTSNTITAATAIENNGTLTVTNSILTGDATAINTVARGIFNDDFGQINILNSSISTSSPTFAETINNEDFGHINLINSSLNANSPTDATGIFNEDFGQMNILNSTISANSSTFAAGIFNEDFGQINILNSRINANSATFAAGIFNEDYGQMNIANSIIIAQSPTQAIGINNQDFGQINIINSIVIPD